jgi:hypothetical protein
MNTMGKKKEAPVTEAELDAALDTVAADEPETETAPKGKGPITFKYRDHAGEPTERTFSKEVHGEDFAKLAAEFKATNAARIIE